MTTAEDDPRLREIQNEILEMIAYGEPLPLVAEALCRRIEAVALEAICSVLSVDAEGRVHPVASPSLPVSYSTALDGLAIGPSAGSCGTAAFRGEPVLVDDIASDPLWEDYRALVLPLGLRACWSSPIKARGGRVIGTFALYYRSERGPSPIERRAVETCVHLCAIALEQMEIRARNHELAFYDPLTGLPNRLHADTLMRRKVEESPEGLGLLVIDIDNLKITNDTLGHAVGDVLIRQVAHRTADTVRPGTACRIGGDEFVAILDDCRSPDGLGRVARRILAAMEAPFTADGHTIVPHVTIGGALCGRDGSDIDTLMQNADLALYDSKENGRGHFVEYSARLRTAMTRRMQRINEVEAALNEGRIVAHYQPVVRLDTKEITGIEALARLATDDGGVIAAGYFQDALKEPRVARRLTDQMLKQVAADLRAWVGMGIPFQHVGVNVSMADFQCGDIAARIAEVFDGADALLHHIVLEVTETVLVGSSDSIVTPAIERLRSMGVRVALDDFGTGYASLTHLLTFPVDIIKIDKSFVDRLVGDTTGGVIVTALVDIATKLGMRIVAEGIETPEQAECLQALGCVLGQGFLYYRAASFEETTRRLLAEAQGLPRPNADAVRRRYVA
jgi:diguanylate cyclase (GGDEF)-like protein